MGEAERELVPGQCPVDECANEICGGPHEEVFTDIGWEVIRPGQHPIGNVLEPTDADELTRWTVINKRRLGD